MVGTARRASRRPSWPSGGGPTAGSRRWFASCTPVGEVRNDAGVDNDEDGAPLRLCEDPVRPWAELWPEVQRLG